MGIDWAEKIGLVVKPFGENNKLENMLYSMHDFRLFLLWKQHPSASYFVITLACLRHQQRESDLNTKSSITTLTY